VCTHTGCIEGDEYVIEYAKFPARRARVFVYFRNALIEESCIEFEKNYAEWESFGFVGAKLITGCESIIFNSECFLDMLEFRFNNKKRRQEVAGSASG